LSPPDFLVIGHVVQDLTPAAGAQTGARPGGQGWRLGGTASYAALLAARLGLKTAALTAAAPDLPLEQAFPGVQLVRVPSDRSTQFRNVYSPQGRVQYVPQRAATIRPDSLPDDWRDAAIVLLGPVAGEVDDALADCFPRSLIGVSAQGWLRRIGADGRVHPVPAADWQAERLLRRDRSVFVSDEDLPAAEARPVLDGWSRRADVVAYTRGDRGADVCHGGSWRHIDAFPAVAVDPTGAGDVFATAFLVLYRESGDPWQATRFAAAAAALITESLGTESVPDRPAIEARLLAHPDIVPR